MHAPLDIDTHDRSRDRPHQSVETSDTHRPPPIGDRSPQAGGGGSLINALLSSPAVRAILIRWSICLRSARRPLPHVLHVADRTMLWRFSPALVAVAREMCARGVRTSLLTDDPQVVTRLTGCAGRMSRSFSLSHLASLAASTRSLLPALNPPPDVVHVWDRAGLWWVQRWAARVGIRCSRMPPGCASQSACCVARTATSTSCCLRGAGPSRDPRRNAGE